jgi:type IV pilus assembly protein PilQ
LKRVALVILSLGCAAEPSPRAPGPVDAPAWAEGSAAAPRAIVLASPAHSTVSLGPLDVESTSKHARGGKRIDLDLVSADLPNVCRLIGELAGVNIVVADGVTGTVTLKLRAVPWEDALDAILLSRGYVKERVGNVIVVRAH